MLVRCIECGCVGSGLLIDHNINCKYKCGYGSAGNTAKPIGTSGGSPEKHGMMYLRQNFNRSI